MLRYDPYAIAPGHVLGFSGKGYKSTVVKLCTYAGPINGLSHVAVVANSRDGELLVFESTSLSTIPCVLQNKLVKGVQAHYLEHVLADKGNRAIYHYPLYRPLYCFEDVRLTEFLMSMLGVPYNMPGALRAAGVGLSWIESFIHPTMLTHLFCSELIAAALSYVGIWPTTMADRWNPALLCRVMRTQGVLRKPRRLR
jgi:hypothetical protein